MNVLVLGLKEWPFNSSKTKSMVKGGGSAKYCDILFKEPVLEKFKFHIVTSLSAEQKKFEIKNNQYIYRANYFKGRKIRHISLALISIIKSIIIIRKNKVNLIFSHMIISNIIALGIGKLFNIPVVIVPHGALYHKYLPYFNNLRRKTERYLERVLYQFADKIIMFSKDDIKNYQIYAKKKLNNFYVIKSGYNSLNIEELSFIYNNRKIKILFVGRLVKLKAVDKLIMSISLLDKKFKNQFVLDIVGEGEELNNLKKLVNQQNIKDCVNFHGFIENPKLFYQNADIFCLVSETEGQSIALMEAMSNYCACVIANFGTQFNDNSLIRMKNNNPSTIFKNLAKLIENTKLISKFAINGKSEIEKNFSSQNFAQHYNKLFISLIKK